MKPDNIEDILGIEKPQNDIGKQSNSISDDSINNLQSDNDDSGKYSALKIVIGLISFLAYTILVIGVLAFFFLLSKEQPLMGLAALIGSIIIALPLLAFSNLIYVFIDIEYNTRKTREELKKSTK